MNKTKTRRPTAADRRADVLTVRRLRHHMKARKKEVRK